MNIVWFRQDLRLADNPALLEATKAGAILPLYILDDENAGEHAMGGACRWWLHHSLIALNAQLDGNLIIRKGDAAQVLDELIAETGATAIYWNRCYEPWRVKRDTAIKAALKDKGIAVHSRDGSLLWEPPKIRNKTGGPYKVFTPFYRKGCLPNPPREPLPVPSQIDYAPSIDRGSIDDLSLLPDINWYTQMEAEWKPGEAGAQARLKAFLQDGLHGYKELRNRPDLHNVSRLSPYLHWGEISPHTVFYAAQEAMRDQGLEKDGDHFCSELGWREFSYYLLYHFPQLTHDNLQKKFDHFPWAEAEPETLKRWQRGLTGYPIVDAGMRELYETGYMHNRVRMVVGSFLVKHLRLHWHHGERWFWDTLLDADLANNSASWQWIAGCGADAAPYFRIFNPITQGRSLIPRATIRAALSQSLPACRINICSNRGKHRLMCWIKRVLC